MGDSIEAEPRAIAFRVSGRPRPQPRPRVVKGRAISMADPRARLWRQAVERAAREAVANSGYGAPALRGAVKLTILFQFATKDETRWAQLHTHKPDASNLLKLVEDAMEAAGALANDSQIANPDVIKMWGERDGMGVTAVECPNLPRGGTVGRRNGGGELPQWLKGP